MRNLLFALAVAPLLSQAVMADTITAQYAGVNPVQGVSVDLNGVAFKNVAAGVYNWNTISGPSFYSPSFKTFCVELTVGLQKQATFTTTTLDSRYDALQVSRLEEFWGNNYTSIGTDANKAAAFQLGVWEIVNESGSTKLDLTSGNFTVGVAPAGLVDLAQSWLDGLGEAGTFETDLAIFDAATSQDQIGVVPPSSVVPVPPGIVLGAIGLVSLVGYGYRRRQAVPVAAAV